MIVKNSTNLIMSKIQTLKEENELLCKELNKIKKYEKLVGGSIKDIYNILVIREGQIYPIWM